MSCVLHAITPMLQFYPERFVTLGSFNFILYLCRHSGAEISINQSNQIVVVLVFRPPEFLLVEFFKSLVQFSPPPFNLQGNVKNKTL